MAKFSKLAFLHGNTFNMLQQKYVCRAVEEEAADMFAEVRNKHRGKPLVVLGKFNLLVVFCVCSILLMYF